MHWMVMPLRRYAVFAGRSRRREYWMFGLLYVTLAVIAAAIDIALGYGNAGTMASAGAYAAYANSWGPAEGIVLLGLLIPSIALTVRRLHDIDKSGWWLLIALVPFIGGIVMLVFACLDGTKGANRFGDDPKERQPFASTAG